MSLHLKLHINEKKTMRVTKAGVKEVDLVPPSHRPQTQHKN